MASSAAGTSLGSEYQVFLSFRGPDTREGFTDVLFHNLTDAGICIFRDDEELRVGERIDGLLQQAIDNSKIYIPVFSRTYAASQWCLRELAQIVENTSRSEGNKEILPIFVDVEPDDVKLKTPLYHNAILTLKLNKKLSNEQVDACRMALKEVGAIKGREVKKYNGHGKLIKLVVEEVVEKLKTKHRLVTEHLVGIDDQVVAVSKLLDINSGDVWLIQIHGMGGIGKTTLARVVFNQFSSHFGKCCCFLEDVRAKSSRTDGLVELQKKLLCEIGHPMGTRIINEIDYGMGRIGEVLRNKKVLIVLDDVDNNEQVVKLVGKSTLCSGSRILITTRNKDVVQIHRPKYPILDYEMEVMSTNHALELFSKHAFNGDSPLYDYCDLSREIVSITGRLPLALEVIGSLLYHKRTQEQWERTLKELRKAPHPDVFGKLKISYDALSFEQQQIFLDIAFFFIGEDKTNAIYMWEDCGLLRDDGVDILNSMCLIKIIGNDKFWMHNQLRDLGREIVQKENQINPGKLSRLWIHKDNLDTITTEEMKKNVQTLDIDLRKSDLKDIKSEEIGRFENLRCLKLKGGTFVGNFANCLTKLRWIFWSHPPPTSNSTNMHFKNVVVLQISYHDFMDDSMLQRLIEMAIKLKVLCVESCPSVTRTPDFSGCLKLERLSFNSCRNLRKIDCSIGKLKCLTDLRIVNCYDLGDLPKEIGGLVNLKHFFLQYCKVTKLPDSIWKLKSLREVHFLGYIYSGIDPTNSWELPSAIGMLQNLEVLLINNECLKGQLPYGIGNLPSLRILDLSFTRVSEVPKTVGLLPRLQRLELRGCHEIQEVPALPTSLTQLIVSSKSLRVVSDLSNLTNLVELNLSDGGGGHCVGELRGFGRLSKLTKLRLGLHNVPTFKELASLHLLKELYLFGLDQQTFPQLPLSLQKLGLNSFNSVMSAFPNLRDLLFLELYESPMQEFQLDGLQLPHLRDLAVQLCEPLERFRLSNMRKLTRFTVSDCPKLAEIQFSWPFEFMEQLSIIWCESLERLVYAEESRHDNNESVKEMITRDGRLILPSKSLKKLQIFKLAKCRKIFEIHVVGTSELWEVFHVMGCPLLQSVHGLPNLKNLESLSICYCKGLQVVEGLDELEFLNQLDVNNCKSLKRLIDISTTKLSNDCHINISDCKKLCGVKKGFEGPVLSFKHYKEQEQKHIWAKFFDQEQESDYELEQESDCDQEKIQEILWELFLEQKQESEFELEQKRVFDRGFQQEREGDFELEQKKKQKILWELFFKRKQKSDFELEQQRNFERKFQQEREGDFELEQESDCEQETLWELFSEQKQKSDLELEQKRDFEPGFQQEREGDFELEQKKKGKILWELFFIRKQESDFELEQKRDFEREFQQEREGDFELEQKKKPEIHWDLFFGQEQESDFKVEQKRDFIREFQQDREGGFELEWESDLERDFEQEQESNFELEQESDLEGDLEQEQESNFELEQESDLERYLEQKQESDFELEQESDFELEQERDFEHEFQQEQGGHFELGQERDFEQEQGGHFELGQERDFEQEQGDHFELEQERDFEQEQEGNFQLEQEFNPRRRLGRVPFLLKIGVATCLSALFLSHFLEIALLVYFFFLLVCASWRLPD